MASSIVTTPKTQTNSRLTMFTNLREKRLLTVWGSLKVQASGSRYCPAGRRTPRLADQGSVRSFMLSFVSETCYHSQLKSVRIAEFAVRQPPVWLVPSARSLRGNIMPRSALDPSTRRVPLKQTPSIRSTIGRRVQSSSVLNGSCRSFSALCFLMGPVRSCWSPNPNQKAFPSKSIGLTLALSRTRRRYA